MEGIIAEYTDKEETVEEIEEAEVNKEGEYIWNDQYI